MFVVNRTHETKLQQALNADSAKAQTAVAEHESFGLEFEPSQNDRPLLTQRKAKDTFQIDFAGDWTRP